MTLPDLFHIVFEGIVSVGVPLGLILSYMERNRAAERATRNDNKLTNIHIDMNSRFSEWLKTTEALGIAKGLELARTKTEEEAAAVLAKAAEAAAAVLRSAAKAP
jgi:hypothetical protein